MNSNSREMKLNSYCILAHRITNSLKFTCEYLSKSGNCSVYIHVDSKSNLDDFLFLKSSCVHLIKERVDVKWGDISMVLATLNLLRNHTGDGYVTLLSADDFPLVDVSILKDFLFRLNGRNLIHFQDNRNNNVDVLKRFKFIYPVIFFRKENNFFTKVLKKIYSLYPFMINDEGMVFIKNHDINIYKGTQWFSLSSESVSLILDYLKNNPGFLKSFEGTYCPDEMFFHTLIMHLKLPLYHDKKRFNDCLRYIDWDSGPQYPKILDMTDYPLLKKSKCLFARKASDSLNRDDFIQFTKAVKNESLY
ncbi:beta-1,6-N-acetylglucosaminyltransferase [Rosenbergiella epipactidis]|uniref:beta-1,6-N-acetylglucosaminyltransferase n=1 Tax=Rosenbergiella epipactidis TaxID=1544694 RepID=UPI001BD92B9F|nr:beta-1,6-N-acetylglucosaminyltransferase [Rosenbergiella epipactidis]